MSRRCDRERIDPLWPRYTSADRWGFDPIFPRRLWQEWREELGVPTPEAVERVRARVVAHLRDYVELP